MQTVYRDVNVVSFPFPSLQHTSSRALNVSTADLVCDVVYLVEGDLIVREEIAEFLRASKIKVIAFESATEYLNFLGRDTAACLVVNTHLRGLSGLELQERLGEKANPPVIFISDQCDIPCTVRAMKAGAMEFLTKPVDFMALIVAVRAAFVQDRKLRHRNADLAKLQERFATLTPREREVLPLIVGGLLNKQSASLLGISEVTLQIHRSQVMRKMQADSLAELVRMAIKLRIQHWRESQPICGQPAEFNALLRTAAQ